MPFKRFAKFAFIQVVGYSSVFIDAYIFQCALIVYVLYMCICLCDYMLLDSLLFFVITIHKPVQKLPWPRLAVILNNNGNNTSLFMNKRKSLFSPFFSFLDFMLFRFVHVKSDYAILQTVGIHSSRRKQFKFFVFSSISVGSLAGLCWLWRFFSVLHLSYFADDGRNS